MLNVKLQVVLIAILLNVSGGSVWRYFRWFPCSSPEVANPLPGVTDWSDRHHEYVPSRVLPDGPRVPRLTRVRLGDLLGEGADSAVYAIEGTEMVIKYKAFSHDSPPYMSEIQREWAMALLVSDSLPGITVRPVFLSESFSVLPGVKLTWGVSNHPVRVQFLITERAGASISSLMHVRKFSLPDAARIGIELIRKLRKLHVSWHFVHGDIHSGNVVAARDGRGVKLIDFGHARQARPVREYTYTGDVVRSQNCHVWYSPWEIRFAEHYSYRSEIFRAIQLVALLSHGPQFHRDMRAICRDRKFDDFVYIKEESNFFDIEIEGFVYPIAPTDRPEKLILLTRALSDAVRAPVGPMASPDYDTIIDLLSKIVRMFEKDDLPDSMEFKFD